MIRTSWSVSGSASAATRYVEGIELDGAHEVTVTDMLDGLPKQAIMGRFRAWRESAVALQLCLHGQRAVSAPAAAYLWRRTEWAHLPAVQMFAM